jgi:GR25 family glycosyltransferase involved in LPS biosynthesis
MAVRPWQGYFINFDRSAERRASMEKQLGQAGLSSLYEPFSALDDAPAAASKLTRREIGRVRSHHAVLSAATADASFVHVVEDNVVFSRHLPMALSASIARGAFDAFDVVHLDAIISPNDHTAVEQLKLAFNAGRELRLIEVKNRRFLAASSYLVNQRSLPKVCEALAAETGGNGPARALDLFYLEESQQGRVRAAVLFPYLTSVAAAPASAAAIPQVEDALRYAFFADFDLKEARRRVPRFLVTPKPDSHTEYLLDVLRYR